MHDEILSTIRHAPGGPKSGGARPSARIRLDGLWHGFFDCSIACEIGNGGKRQLVIRAGKSHKFTIPEEEVPR